MEKLQDPSAVAIFKALFGGRFATLNMEDCIVDTLDGNLKELLLSVIQEILGRHGKKNQPLITKDILDLLPEEVLEERGKATPKQLPSRK